VVDRLLADKGAIQGRQHRNKQTHEEANVDHEERCEEGNSKEVTKLRILEVGKVELAEGRIE